MLISFAATNHRSLRDRAEVSFVAESTPTTDDRARLAVPGFETELVPVIGLYGPNGSGKSTFLDALAHFIDTISRSHNQWTPGDPPERDPFITPDGRLGAASTYELVFVSDDSVYSYRASIGAQAIEHEELSVASAGPRSWTRLYERTAAADGTPRFKFGRRLTGPRAAAEAATRPNSLFLSAAAQNNHPLLLGLWASLRTTYQSAVPANRRERARYTANRLHEGDDEYQERLRKFVASADLGIADLVANVTPMSPERIEVLKRVIAAASFEEEPPEVRDEDLVVVETLFRHSGDVGTLALAQESTGTQAWFEWSAPVLEALDEGTVLSADELDAGLNTHLVSRIVAAFQHAETNQHGAQLLYTGHDTSVVTLAGLARDQIVIVEKDATGASRLVPVTDFQSRREWEVGRAYSHGRYGGLPIPDDDALAAALGAPYAPWQR
jgi:energy-coupling factor transporter ATP-binding protein EcfA2